MYISNVQWRGGILGDRHDAVCVAWGCYCGCPDCTKAGAGEHFRFSKINTLRGLESVAWRICCGLPCQMGCHCLTFIWIFFFYDFIFIYLNSRVIHTYQCTTPVNLLWRTGAGPMLQPSNRFRPSCGVLPHAHWDMEANDGILWTALVTWHFWHHFMLVVVSLAAN